MITVGSFIWKRFQQRRGGREVRRGVGEEEEEEAGQRFPLRLLGQRNYENLGGDNNAL